MCKYCAPCVPFLRKLNKSGKNSGFTCIALAPIKCRTLDLLYCMYLRCYNQSATLFTLNEKFAKRQTIPNNDKHFNCFRALLLIGRLFAIVKTCYASVPSKKRPHHVGKLHDSMGCLRLASFPIVCKHFKCRMFIPNVSSFFSVLSSSVPVLYIVEHSQCYQCSKCFIWI